MEKVLKSILTNLMHDEGGQAFVEYVLGLAMVVTVTTLMAKSFRSTLWKLWKGLATEIAAPCPGCPAKLTN